MTFGVDGEHRRFDVDLMPRVIVGARVGGSGGGPACSAPGRWSASSGTCTASSAILADGVLCPERVVRTRPAGATRPTRLPPASVRGPVMGFDLVRNEFGGWRVLEDNLRNPSGAAYAIAIRDLMDEVLPDLPRPAGLLAPADALPRAPGLPAARPSTQGRTATAACSLSSGPSSSAWFEHRLLAERAGLLLLVADDLEVTRRAGRWAGAEPGRRALPAARRRAGRSDRPRRAPDRRRGVRRGRGRAGCASPTRPGNGVADDKSMYCYVPELIAYYLQERPLLESVPTYRTSDAAECRIVLERVGELVTKPVDGHGGVGVLIGPDASASEVAARRAEIAANPSRLGGPGGGGAVVASDVRRGSAGAAPRRPAGLRLPAGHRPGRVPVADLGLTRVAPEGSLVVNSSRGGGAKDTWIIGELTHDR